MLSACGLFSVGCGDNSTGTAPELSPADIQRQQTNEAEARVKAFGKGGGTPGSKNAAKAAAKAASSGEAPKAEEATKAEEKPAP